MIEEGVPSIQRTVKRYMDAEANRIADAVEAGREWDTDDDAMLEMLRGAVYEPTFLRFARAAYGATEAASKKAANVEAWIETVLRIIRGEGARRVKGIGDFTKRHIRSIIQAVQAQGGGVDEAARQIRTEIPEINISRSERIARTEMNSAAMAGTQEGVLSAATELGMEVGKIWYPSPDDRVRDSHQSVNGGKPVPLDGTFTVGGATMQYPGEFGAPAEEVINCRCTLLYEVL